MGALEKTKQEIILWLSKQPEKKGDLVTQFLGTEDMSRAMRFGLYIQELEEQRWIDDCGGGIFQISDMALEDLLESGTYAVWLSECPLCREENRSKRDDFQLKRSRCGEYQHMSIVLCSCGFSYEAKLPPIEDR